MQLQAASAEFLAAVALFQRVKLLSSWSDPTRDMVGAVQGDKAASIGQRGGNIPQCFQMVAVRSITPAIPILKNLPHNIFDHRAIRSASQSQLSLGLLRQNREYSCAVECGDMGPCHESKTVACAKGGLFPPGAYRLQPGKHPLNRPCVFMSQRAAKDLLVIK